LGLAQALFPARVRDPPVMSGDRVTCPEAGVSAETSRG